MSNWPKYFFCILLGSLSFNALACRDNVVLVHGTAVTSATWNTTVNLLKTQFGYQDEEIFRPNYGIVGCVACNDHNGSEEVPVRNALVDALTSSCTGRIDVIGHSMGVSLSGQQIRKLGIQNQVDAFIGVAGAVRGNWACGRWPFPVLTSACGANGFSINSPFINGLSGQRFGNRVYSIYSNVDNFLCTTWPNGCFVNGQHTSRIWSSDDEIIINVGHNTIQWFSAAQQASLIQ